MTCDFKKNLCCVIEDCYLWSNVSHFEEYFSEAVLYVLLMCFLELPVPELRVTGVCSPSLLRQIKTRPTLGLIHWVQFSLFAIFKIAFGSIHILKISSCRLWWNWQGKRNDSLFMCADMIATWSSSASSKQNMASLQENVKRKEELKSLLEKLSQWLKCILFYIFIQKKRACDRGQDTT